MRKNLKKVVLKKVVSGMLAAAIVVFGLNMNANVAKAASVELIGGAENEAVEITPNVSSNDLYIKNSDVSINGFQISTTVEGLRTIYSVENKIDNKEVVHVGMIYSVADYATEDELYVGCTNPFVASFQATEQGISSINYSGSETATSYIMTMKFGPKTVAEFTARYRVRAYAELSDGTYVYSNAREYTVYDVADKLYQGRKMSNFQAHNYLYTDILKVVNPDYVAIDFDWNDSLV